MDSETFRKAGKDSIDFIINVITNIRERSAVAEVKPGYLYKLLSDSAPENGEPWTKIEQDFRQHIMAGVVSWNSPRFAGYFPVSPGYPDILGDILTSGLGCVGVNWLSGPAMTELEVIVLNWMAKMLDLPKHFLGSSQGSGGGVIHLSASEGFFVALVAAKTWKTKEIITDQPCLDEDYIRSKLVLYTSEQSNSSIEKTGLLGSMLTRLLPCNEEGSMTLETLKMAVEKDIMNGLYPCYVILTLGSTSVCSFDHLADIGPYCAQQRMWLHVDAAYSGSGLVCPEFRYITKGLEYADSMVINPYKWMMSSFDSSAFWTKHRQLIINAMYVDRVYFESNLSTTEYAPEFRHWEISLGRRFRSLKLWFTLRSYGVKGIQQHIRNTCRLAHIFLQLILSDQRFTVFQPQHMSLVAFRVKDDHDNKLTKKLLNTIIENKKIFMVGAEVNGNFYMRFVVTSIHSTEEDIHYAYNIISQTADTVLN